MSLNTEEEANRWHVQARRDPETGEQFKGFAQPNPEQCRCIASECMAWRWGTDKEMDDMIANGFEDTLYGYCGLAGAPLK